MFYLSFPFILSFNSRRVITSNMPNHSRFIFKHNLSDIRSIGENIMIVFQVKTKTKQNEWKKIIAFNTNNEMSANIVGTGIWR